MDVTPIDVLIAEDELAHAEAIRRALEGSDADFAVRIVKSLCEYRRMVAERAPHVAIVDLNLPDGRAMEVLRGCEKTPGARFAIEIGGGVW